MAEKRAGMMWSPGKEGPLGWWPDHLDANNGGWTGKSHNVRQEVLNIGRRYHDQSFAIHKHQQAPNSPPPELPDIQARNQLAREDYKRLQKLGDQMAAINKEISTKESLLQPFDYDGSLVDAHLRSEMRSHLRSLNEEQRREKMREYSWRRAALEGPPELSALSPVQHKSYADETLRLRYPNELTGIAAGKEALQAVSTAFDTVRKAVDHELKSTTTTDQGPPPEKSEPWI